MVREIPYGHKAFKTQNEGNYEFPIYYSYQYGAIVEFSIAVEIHWAYRVTTPVPMYSTLSRKSFDSSSLAYQDLAPKAYGVLI